MTGMHTDHHLIFQNAADMAALADESIDLVVTSPPYPMIEMWDDIFCSQDPSIREKQEEGDGPGMFEAMHKVLDVVWPEISRVLKPGGFACINIGDATRTIDGHFSLYPNHARILTVLSKTGLSVLPCILWRKQTNAPNKFMGSGMLPAGAYVTLEHEYILILRKGAKRVFRTEKEKQTRRESAVFWEERNIWFSDVWMDIKGTGQVLSPDNGRKRSGAFPFEVAYRLINMYSVKGDLVLDPFAGTGTTLCAAMTAGRNSIGYEIDRSLGGEFKQSGEQIIDTSRAVIQKRLLTHIDFMHDRIKTKGRVKHENSCYGFPVVTAQEKFLILNEPVDVRKSSEYEWHLEYSDGPLFKLNIQEFKNDRIPPVKFDQYSLF